MSSKEKRIVLLILLALSLGLLVGLVAEMAFDGPGALAFLITIILVVIAWLLLSDRSGTVR